MIYGAERTQHVHNLDDLEGPQDIPVELDVNGDVVSIEGKFCHIKTGTYNTEPAGFKVSDVSAHGPIILLGIEDPSALAGTLETNIGFFKYIAEAEISTKNFAAADIPAVGAKFWFNDSGEICATNSASDPITLGRGTRLPNAKGYDNTNYITVRFN